MVLIVILSLQATHHFRAELANQPVIGPLVRSVYSALGSEITPKWDLEQYKILDWTATTDPSVGGGDTLNQAISMVRPAGNVHVFGLPTSYDKVPFDLGGFFMKRVKITNTFGAQDEPGLSAFREALDLIERGEIDMAPFVTDVFPLERVDDALALAHEPTGGALKVSLSMA